MLDSKGKLVRWFDGFRRTQRQRFPRTQQRESVGNYTARKLRETLFELDINRKPSGEYPLKRPDLKEPGIHVFVQLLDDRMRA